MTYVSYADLAKDIRSLAPQVRGRFNAVCGVPRSGVLAASMLAVHLHIPLLSPSEALCSKERVLILDDSIYMGSALNNFKAKWGDHDHWSYGAVYASPETDGRNDGLAVMGRVIEMPRLFEWNLFHHPSLNRALLDIDGVLCQEPEGLCDEMPGYLEHIAGAEPLYLPRVKVAGIVTGRLERHRDSTVAWLTSHNVEYDVLVMAPYDTPADRRRSGQYGSFKGEVLKGDQYDYMIESDATQAIWAAKTACKPVVCIETHTVVNTWAE